MQFIEAPITVSWRHQVYFTRRVFAPDNLLLRDVLLAEQATESAKGLLVLDASLARARSALVAEIEQYFAAHAPALRLVCAPLVMAGGERIKNGHFHVSMLHAQLDRYHVDRHNYVLCVGGGALLDMVGLAAATAHRGVRHVRLPTTTLSQADSGVGVKNGINAFGKKNFIGTFAPPYAVINDFDFLDTLSARDQRAGYVEAVKVACIRERAFFEEIERLAEALSLGEPQSRERVIARCAELHVQHIATGGDPFENGAARPLDFGHWAAHKLEMLSEFRLRHGEAVAVGMALDVVYARRAGLLDGESAERILRLLERLGFDLFVSELSCKDALGHLVVLNGLEEFREHLGGRLNITLLAEIGRSVEVQTMDRKLIEEAINELCERGKRSDAKG